MIMLHYPSLPLLSEAMQQMCVRILSRIMGEVVLSRVLREPLIESLYIKIPSYDQFRESLITFIMDTAHKLEELKVAPITVRGRQSELRAYLDNKIVPYLRKKYDIRIEGRVRRRGRTEAVYSYLARILKAYSETIPDSMSGFIKTYCIPWRIQANEKTIIFSAGEGLLKIPSIIRTTIFYEQARFSGLRYMGFGPVKEVLFDIRCSIEWWLKILSAVLSSLTTQIILRPARPGERPEVVQLYTGINMMYGMEYESTDIKIMTKGIETVMDVCSKLRFLEDLEILKYMILFKLYIEGAMVPKTVEYIIYGIKPADARFTSVFTLAISNEELSTMERGLKTIWGDEADNVVEALYTYGETLIRLYRIPEIHQIIPLDRLLATYKLLCYASTEPGYKPPTDLAYEIARNLYVEDTLKPIQGMVAKIYVERGLSEDRAFDASKRVINTLNRILGAFS